MEGGKKDGGEGHWLVLCQLDTSYSHSVKGNLNGENVSTRLACG